jgi:hypothetical protein
MAGAVETYFAAEKPAFDAITKWSGGTLTACLCVAALFILVAAFTFRPFEKAVLFAWLVLP